MERLGRPFGQVFGELARGDGDLPGRGADGDVDIVFQDPAAVEEHVRAQRQVLVEDLGGEALPTKLGVEVADALALYAVAHQAAEGIVAAEAVAVIARAEHGFGRQHVEGGLADKALDIGAVGQHELVAHQREVLPHDGVVAAVRLVGAHPLRGPFHEGVGPQAAAGRVLDVAAVVRQAGAPGARHAAFEFVALDEAQVLVPGEEALLERNRLQLVAFDFAEDIVIEMIAEFPVEMLSDPAREVELAGGVLAAELVVGRGHRCVVSGGIAVEAVEVVRFLVVVVGGEGKADAGNQEAVVVAQGVALRALEGPGRFRVDLLPRVGIVGGAEIVGIAQQAELHAHVGVISQDRETAEREARLGDILLLRARAEGEGQQQEDRGQMLCHISHCLISFTSCSFCRRSLPLKR